MDKCLITVITVCKNAINSIDETMKSVISQTYPNIEYIIIDGGSTDGTLKAIKDAAKSFSIRYVSEPDSGIYDAMNKGIELATGRYIYFLNAGDTLTEKCIISKVVSEIKRNKGDIFYGNIIYRYPNGKFCVRNYGYFCGKKIYYCTGDCINHQAIFADSNCFKEHKFDTSYRICGDREWMMHMHKMKVKFKSLSLIICNYSLDNSSVSLVNSELYHLEAARCMKKYFPLTYWIFLMFEAFRKNAFSSHIIHYIYKLLYIRKDKGEKAD